MKNGLPGSLWINHGLWNWRVKLPGAESRTNMPVKLAGKKTAISATKPKSFAESAAWRMWEAATNAAPSPRPESPTVEDLCQGYCRHALVYYRDRKGEQTGEAVNVTWGLRFYRREIGRKRIDDVTHAELVEVRRKMVEEGSARTSVNKRIGIWNRMMGWALDEGLIGAALKAELSQVSPLKAFRSQARDTEPIKAAEHHAVKAAIAMLPPNLADMVRVQELSGMRPGEVCKMRWEDVERKRGVWLYRPESHKNAYRGLPRVVVLGPMAQRALMRHERRSGRVFCPRLAMLERYNEMREARKTHVQPSQVDRSRPGAMRKPGDAWIPTAYSRAVMQACKAAVEAGTMEAGDAWAPNQLRHACATRVRRWFGINAARAVMGHSWGGSRITDRYSWEAVEAEFIREATPAMMRIG